MNEQHHPEIENSCIGTDASGDYGRYLQAIVEGTSDAMFIKDRDGRYRLCNAAAAQFLGKRAEEIIGQDDFALFPVTATESIREQDRLVMDDVKTVTSEETLAMSDGASRTFRTTKGPIFDEDRRVCGLFGITRDLTEQRQGERALLEAHTAVEWAVEGIAKLDETGRYLFVNTQYAALLGYRPDELIAQSGKSPCIRMIDICVGRLCPDARDRKGGR